MEYIRLLEEQLQMASNKSDVGVYESGGFYLLHVEESGEKYFTNKITGERL